MKLQVRRIKTFDQISGGESDYYSEEQHDRTLNKLNKNKKIKPSPNRKRRKAVWQVRDIESTDDNVNERLSLLQDDDENLNETVDAREQCREEQRNSDVNTRNNDQIKINIHERGSISKSYTEDMYDSEKSAITLNGLYSSMQSMSSSSFWSLSFGGASKGDKKLSKKTKTKSQDAPPFDLSTLNTTRRGALALMSYNSSFDESDTDFVYEPCNSLDIPDEKHGVLKKSVSDSEAYVRSNFSVEDICPNSRRNSMKMLQEYEHSQPNENEEQPHKTLTRTNRVLSQINGNFNGTEENCNIENENSTINVRVMNGIKPITSSSVINITSQVDAKKRDNISKTEIDVLKEMNAKRHSLHVDQCHFILQGKHLLQKSLQGKLSKSYQQSLSSNELTTNSKEAPGMLNEMITTDKRDSIQESGV